MSWTLPAFSSVDSAGNSGPASDSVLELTLMAPAPSPTEPEAAVAPELGDNIQSPVEAPESINPEVVEGILEFIESDEAPPTVQESPSQVVATVPTQSNELTIGANPAKASAEHF
jgi:hypothetical protein